jgi:hypothetical protein
MNAIDMFKKLQTLFKSCDESENPNKYKLHEATKQLVNKPLIVLINDVGKFSSRTNTETEWTPHGGETAKAVREQVQLEFTRRLIVEIRNFNKSTNRLSLGLIGPTFVLVILTFVLAWKGCR